MAAKWRTPLIARGKVKSDHLRRLLGGAPLHGRGILAVKDLDPILLYGGVAERDLRSDEVVHPNALDKLLT